SFLTADNVTATDGRAAGSTVGTYHITATLSPASVLGNYTITNAGADFTINKRLATWATTAARKTYGDGDPTPLTTGSGRNFVAGDGVSASYGRAAGETVASSPYHITATLSPASVLGNYTITNAGASFTITPKALTITADNKSKQYSDALNFTATYGGFASGEGPGNLAGALSCSSPGATGGAGTYPIMCSGQTSTNYVITYVAGTLTVTKEDATVSYDNPEAFQVGSPGGTATISLTASVQETNPEPQVGAGAAAGNINLAGIIITLTPVGPGSPISSNNCSSNAAGPGYTSKSFTCSFGSVPVNTYSVVAQVTGNYYTGSTED